MSFISSDSFLSSTEDLMKWLLFDLEEDKVIVQSKPRTMRKERQHINKSNYWTHVFPNLPHNIFVKKYRRSKDSFLNLTDKYYEFSGYKSMDTWLKCLAIGIEYLSTRARICDLMLAYNCAQGLAHYYINKCIEIIVNHALPDVCKWPEENERKEIAIRFTQKYNLPMCAGAIDGTLIRIKGYEPTKAKLTTRKSHYSFNLLLVCDDNALVRYYVNGAAGSFSDESIFKPSELHLKN